MILASLHGCNNIRRLQYEIKGKEIVELYQQLQTISSPLLSEVHFIYHIDQEEHLKLWCDIDNLMVKNFLSLSIVTIEWLYPAGVAWEDCVSRSANYFPRLHQSGILCTVLPQGDYLL